MFFLLFLLFCFFSFSFVLFLLSNFFLLSEKSCNFFSFVSVSLSCRLETSHRIHQDAKKPLE